MPSSKRVTTVDFHSHLRDEERSTKKGYLDRKRYRACCCVLVCLAIFSGVRYSTLSLSVSEEDDAPPPTADDNHGAPHHDRLEGPLSYLRRWLDVL